MTTHNGIGWFEIGTPDTARAQAFYGGLFGWTFGRADTAGFAYHDITTGPDGPIRGGMLDTGGQRPPYAVFVVHVADVAATCAAAADAGGTVDLGPVTADDGLSFAYLSDPDGSRFGVFSRPPT